MLLNRWLFSLWFPVLMVFSGSAFAVLSIEICGGAGDNAVCSGASSLLQDTWSGTLTGMSIGSSHDLVKICSTSGSGICVDYPLAPSKPWPTPSGWTVPSGGSVNPTPPGTADQVGEYCATTGAGTSCNAVLDTMLTALASAYCSEGMVCTAAVVGSDVQVSVQFPPDPPYVDLTVPLTSPGCPSGYTLSGGACNLSDASLVVKPTDGICNVQRVTGAYAFDTNDPDCATASTDLGATAGGANLTHAGDLSTLGVALDVQLNANGTVNLLASKACTGGICYSYSEFGVPASGGLSPTLQGLQGGSVTGTADLPSGVGAGGFGGSGGAGGTGQSVTVNTCGRPGEAPCKLDETGTSDSAGAGAAGAALKGSYDTLKGQADAAAGSGDMSTFGVGKYEAPADATGSVLNPFAGSHSCVDPVIVMLGQSLTLGVCALTAPLKAILFWALNVMAAMYAWSAFARRREGVT